jgi:hypothetical protein
MGRRKDMQDMSVEELLEEAARYKEQRDRHNARRRERRRWLKTAPREQTALRYRREEKPCSVAQYLQAERHLLQWIDEFPDIKGDAMQILLVLSHTILHIIHPEKLCTGDTLADCPAFSTHDLCTAAIDIALNFRLDPKFKVTHAQVFSAMMGLAQGVDLDRLRFNSLLGDISIDL